MKKILLLLLLLPFFMQAQNQKIEKIVNYYKQGQYEKCSTAIKKYQKKHNREPLPYYFSGFCYFQDYVKAKPNAKRVLLMRTLSGIKTAKLYDKNLSLFDAYDTLLNKIHDTSVVFAKKLYAKEPASAEFFLDALAYVYSDTLPEYRDLHKPEPQEQKPVQKLAFGDYKGPVNQVDKQGRKQGLWIEKNPDGTVKYEIMFLDNHPSGIYRKYYPDGTIKADMYFTRDGKRCRAILYDKQGRKIAMGYYYDKKKDSLWQYVVNDSILLAEENYRRGVKNGAEVVYNLYRYPDTLLIRYWKNGKPEGVLKQFYPSGSPQYYIEYKNGKRNGRFYSYDVDGRKNIIGFYKNGLSEGEWLFWNDSTNSYKKIVYKNGEPVNKEQLLEEETKELQRIEKMKGKIEEPNIQFRNKYSGGQW